MFKIATEQYPEQHQKQKSHKYTPKRKNKLDQKRKKKETSQKIKEILTP